MTFVYTIDDVLSWGIAILLVGILIIYFFFKSMFAILSGWFKKKNKYEEDPDE